MAEKQQQKQEIPAMYGTFRLYGEVESISKNIEGETKTGRQKRTLSLRIKTANDNKVELLFSAVAQDNVYFVKRDQETRKTIDTKIIPWEDRIANNLPEEYEPMSSVTVGVEQKVGEDNGKMENILHHRIMYDALKDLCDHVNIGDALFIRGQISVEQYTQGGELKNVVRFNPGQIYKRTTADPIDFNAIDFVEQNEIVQRIIPQSVEFNDSKTLAAVKGLVIGNKKMGVIEFEIPESEMNFAKSVERNIETMPTVSVEIHAKMVNGTSIQKEEDSFDDFWGTTGVAKQQRRSGFGETKFLFTAITKDSTDKETYTEENINQFKNTFCRGKEEFGNTNAATASSPSSADDLWGSI